MAREMYFRAFSEASSLVLLVQLEVALGYLQLGLVFRPLEHNAARFALGQTCDGLQLPGRFLFELVLLFAELLYALLLLRYLLLFALHRAGPALQVLLPLGHTPLLLLDLLTPFPYLSFRAGPQSQSLFLGLELQGLPPLLRLFH